MFSPTTTKICLLLFGKCHGNVINDTMIHYVNCYSNIKQTKVCAGAIYILSEKSGWRIKILKGSSQQVGSGS